jgi:hypothetical protein
MDAVEEPTTSGSSSQEALSCDHESTRRDQPVEIPSQSVPDSDSPAEPPGPPPIQASVGNHWQPRILLFLLILGFGLRIAYIRLIDTPPFSDMADYETMALNLLEGKGLIMSDLYKAYRPPLYPLWIAAVYQWRGIEPFNVYLTQCVMSILTVVLAYLFTYWVFAPAPQGRAGPDIADTDVERHKDKARTIALMSAALFCFDETSIFFCGQMLTETLFTLLFLAWAYLLVRGVFRPSLPLATAAGIIGGLGILTRPNLLPILVGGTYWFFRASRNYYHPPPSDWRRFSLLDSPFAPPFVMVLYASLVVSFWTMRNEAVVGQLVPVSTNQGVNFYLGHHEDFGYNSFGNKEGIRMGLRARGSYDELVESKIFTLIALQYIHAHPWEDLMNNLSKVYHLYLAPASPISAIEPWKWLSYLDSPYRPWPWETQHRELRFWPVREENGEVRMPSYERYFWQEGRLPLLFWGWPLIYLTVAGIIWSLRGRERVKFPLLVILIYTVILMVYFANARFRAPLLPFLYPFAAYTVVSLWEKLRRQ